MPKPKEIRECFICGSINWVQHDIYICDGCFMMVERLLANPLEFASRLIKVERVVKKLEEKE